MIFEVFIEYLKISVLSTLLIAVVLSVSKFVGMHFRKTWHKKWGSLAHFLFLMCGIKACPMGMVYPLTGRPFHSPLRVADNPKAAPRAESKVKMISTVCTERRSSITPPARVVTMVPSEAAAAGKVCPLAESADGTVRST